jgi:hypothetical protein
MEYCTYVICMTPWVQDHTTASSLTVGLADVRPAFPGNFRHSGSNIASLCQRGITPSVFVQIHRHRQSNLSGMWGTTTITWKLKARRGARAKGGIAPVLCASSMRERTQRRTPNALFSRDGDGTNFFFNILFVVVNEDRQLGTSGLKSKPCQSFGWSYWPNSAVACNPNPQRWELGHAGLFGWWNAYLIFDCRSCALFLVWWGDANCVVWSRRRRKEDQTTISANNAREWLQRRVSFWVRYSCVFEYLVFIVNNN